VILLADSFRLISSINGVNAKIPETRQSLLIRVQNADDGVAWREFEAIYRPAVYRFARRRQLQAADAEDVAQQVFVAIAKKLPVWATERRRGSFRAWLLTVTRNAVTNKLGRIPEDVACGGTSVTLRLAEIAESTERDPTDDALMWEIRRVAFRRAAEIVRPEFVASSWQAFWRSAVTHEPIENVAQELNLSLGAVYTARSRILKRLRETVQEFDLDLSGVVNP
jgi:RNA polymerase sigma-70 factor (ECF subfamily)